MYSVRKSWFKHIFILQSENSLTALSAPLAVELRLHLWKMIVPSTIQFAHEFAVVSVHMEVMYYNETYRRVQKRCNSSALVMELRIRISCTNPLICE